METVPTTDGDLGLYLLGGFRAERNGFPIPTSAWLRRTAARTLVKLLAIRPDHRVHREEVLELLWPETDLDAALNRFGKALHAARRALEPELEAHSTSSYLYLRDDILALDTERVWIDVDHFEMMAKRALPSADLQALDTALATNGGVLLPEDQYEDWTMARRESLARLHIQTLSAHASVLEQNGMYDRAEDDLRHVLVLDALQEESHRSLMRLFALSGRRSEAVHQYQICRDALKREIGAEPEQETVTLYREILAERGGTSAPSPPLPDPIRSFLPQPLRQQPATRTCGRSRVLDILRADVIAAADGRGSVALVTGEAGIGKTRLAADVGREASQRNVLVLWGSACAREHLAPYRPFIEALEGYLVTRTIEERAQMAERYPSLALLIPSLSEFSRDTVDHAAPAVLHAQLLAAFAALFARLAETQPVLLVLDDVLNADEASLQLLQYLARIATDHRWLILATYGEEDVIAGTYGCSLVASLSHENFVRHIFLGRLSRRDADQLVHDLLAYAPDPALLHRVYALSLGNPAFIRELLAAEREQDDGSNPSEGPVPGVSTPAPAGVRQLVITRIASLGDDVRRVLTLAAFVGMEWTYDDIHAAAKTAFPAWFSAAALLEAIDRALEAQIIEDVSGVFRFRHPLFHSALTDQTPSHWRSHLHAAVGGMLEQRRSLDVHRLAYHFSRSHDGDKAILYLAKAGEQAWNLHSYDAAQTYFRDLMVRLEGAGRWAEHASALEKLGGVLSYQAHYDEAIQELEKAAKRFQALGDLEAAGRVVARIGRLHYRRGTPTLGRERLESMLEQIERARAVHGHELPRVEGAGSSEGEAERCLYAVQALLYGTMGDFPHQQAVAERASALARAAGDVRNLAVAEFARAVAHVGLKKCVDARQILESSVIHLAESTHDLDILSRAHTTIAFTHAVDQRNDLCKRALAQALTAAEQLGDPICLAFVNYQHGVIAYLMSDTLEARRRFENALRLGTTVSDDWVAPYALMGIALLHGLQHERQEAMTCLLRSLEAAKRVGDPVAQRAPYDIFRLREKLGMKPEAGRDRAVKLFREAGELLDHKPEYYWSTVSSVEPQLTQA